jgi:hypothetical protein
MTRRPAAILLALAAVGALSAAKPAPPVGGPGALDEGREYWRGQTISHCVGELRAVPDLSPDDLESICGCATDRLLAGSAPLPPVTMPLPLPVRGPITACTMRIHPDATSAVTRLGMTAGLPVPVPPPAIAPKPVDQADVGPPAESQESGGSGSDFWDWVRSITLPAWLTGASALLWVALGILVFGLLILKIRRRDPRNDLLGPPRRGGPPQPPRRPDLPR